MSAPTLAPPTPPPARTPPPRTGVQWVSGVAAGLAVLLAGTCMVAVLQGTGWLGGAAAAVAVVVVVGLVLQRRPAAVVAAGQLVALLLLLTALYGDGPLAGFLPGPGSFAAFADHLREASEQIDSGIAPVEPVPGTLFLITLAFGVLTVIVYAASVHAGAPAAAGVPLLCLVAVPAALSATLLPWWTVLCAAAGYGLLLIARDGATRRGGSLVTGGIVVVAAATVVGLVLGSAVTVVGTQGRFTSGAGGGSGGGGSIGLSPFTSLRGDLVQNAPVELFRTTGMPQPTYLRALTLSEYRPNTGWQADPPLPGVPLAGPLTPGLPPGDPVRVRVQNVGFRDYWLPLYGVPGSVTQLDDPSRWAYDQVSGIAYAQRPQEPDSWVQTGVLASPTAAQLRASSGTRAIDPRYLNATGVDPRVRQIAVDATRGATTPFDQAVALTQFFTGPASPFRYSLQTAPGNGDDALVEFLTIGRTGYCEQYASAMAVMLRTLNIPARVAVGFTPGIQQDGYFSVSTADAHAWVEAWFPGYGWTTFDPTPLTDGRTVVPPYVREAVGSAGGGSAESAPADDVPQPEQAAPAPDQAETPPAEEAAPAEQAPAESSPLPVLVFLGGIVLLLLAGPLVLRAVLRRRRLAAASTGGSSASRAAWAEVLAASRDHGGSPVESDTLRETARALVEEHDLDEQAQQDLGDVVRILEADWYGGTEPAPGALDRPLAGVLGAIRSRHQGSRITAVVPRSLLPH